MSDEIEISQRVERIIWKSMGQKSAREVSEETGLTPEKVLAIRKELLERVDDLSIKHLKQKLLVDLQTMADEARDRAARMPDEFYAGAVNASVSAIKAVLVELNRLTKDDDEKIERLNAMRVRELLSLVDRGVVRSAEALAAQYNIDVGDILNVFNEELVEAAKEMDE